MIKQAAFAALIITDRRGGNQQNVRHSVSRQLRYHQDAGSYQRKPVRKNPETTEQTALRMLFSFSLTMCRPLNRGFMIVALCSDFIHQKARYAGFISLYNVYLFFSGHFFHLFAIHSYSLKYVMLFSFSLIALISGREIS